MKKMVICDPADLKRLLRERRRCGGDRYDEVWDGVYVMSPLADTVHQALVTYLSIAFVQAIDAPGRGVVLAGANVSDRREGWTKNYRCPDVVVFLPGNPAEDCGTHWRGGPDFAVEVISRRDRARKKFAFYKEVGVRELLLVDRNPWGLELYRVIDDEWELVGKSEPEQSNVLTSAVLPLTFRLLPAVPRPQIEVAHPGRDLKWLA